MSGQSVSNSEKGPADSGSQKPGYPASEATDEDEEESDGEIVSLAKKILDILEP